MVFGGRLTWGEIHKVLVIFCQSINLSADQLSWSLKWQIDVMQVSPHQTNKTIYIYISFSPAIPLAPLKRYILIFPDDKKNKMLQNFLKRSKIKSSFFKLKGTKKPQKVTIQMSLTSCGAKEFTDGWDRPYADRVFRKSVPDLCWSFCLPRECIAIINAHWNGQHSLQLAVHKSRLHTHSQGGWFAKGDRRSRVQKPCQEDNLLH